MFHLLTSQISFRTTLGPTDGEWQNYIKASYDLLCDEKGDPPTGDSLLTKLQKHMPHWTPKQADKAVYTAVDKAHSGLIDDVSAYLFKLKKDVCIGAPGYPKYIVIGGDQQT